MLWNSEQVQGKALMRHCSVAMLPVILASGCVSSRAVLLRDDGFESNLAIVVAEYSEQDGVVELQLLLQDGASGAIDLNAEVRLRGRTPVGRPLLEGVRVESSHAYHCSSEKALQSNLAFVRSSRRMVGTLSFADDPNKTTLVFLDVPLRRVSSLEAEHWRCQVRKDENGVGGERE